MPNVLWPRSFPDAASLSAVRAWYAGVGSREAVGRYCPHALGGGQSARGVIGRIRRQLAGFALSRHRADLARPFQCAAGERTCHRKAATRALDIMPTLTVPQPQVSDPVDVWLPPRVVPVLHRHGIRTLADLTVRIPRRRRWWLTIVGLGERSARRIEAFFAAHSALTERARALVVVVTPEPVVPWESIRVPHDVDGSRGTFRAPKPMCALEANNDYQAISAWLERHEATETQRAYRREAERLLLWAIVERGKALSSLTSEDATAYRAFLRHPAPRARWVAPARPRSSSEWRPFTGALSPDSIAYALSVLGAMFRWLIEQRYVLANPFAGLKVRGAQRNGETPWLTELAAQEARTKIELPDIINVLIEDLVRRRYELPPQGTLQRIATQARNELNEAIYGAITGTLDTSHIERIDALLVVRAGKSGWDDLKQEPKRPAARAIASFLKHINGIRTLAEGLPAPPAILSVSKRAQLITEARALDVAELRSLKAEKRYALAVLFIQAQLQKALDDVAEIFIKVMRKFESYAKVRLQKYQLEHADVLEGLVGQFRDVLQILQDEGVSERNRLPKIREALGDPAEALAQCNEHIAYAGQFDLPFMLVPYRNQRSLLFQCLDVLPLRSSSQDRAVLVALAWLQGFRNAHREYLLLTENDLANLPLDWLPEKWERAVFPHGRDSRMLHRRFFELGVFSQIMRELNSGDLYVEGSDRFDDYRVHQVSDEEFQRELPRYCEIVGLPMDGKAFAKDLRDKLNAALDETDANFPANDSIEFVDQELVIHKPGKEPEPPNRTLIDQAISASMPQVSILDLLTETEQWLDLHKLFGPLSGFDAKVDDPRKRFITTLFCYGCNLGPSQTARSVKGLSRKQVAWLNLKHVTEERLDKANVKVINAYNQFALPKYWGSGKRASADGTKWSLYEQNLLSEYHVRYGGYGGIGYYHVSDMYIALFSHLIPCGVHEAVYILDGLILNGADVKPDTIHGDTQAQSGPVFGLSYVTGINLMPRMRNIKDLVLYKVDRRRKYKHIDSLCRKAIDWELIERHYPDMMRVAVSIKAGKMTPSTILRRLGSESTKNKLYFAFRELGRVIRTLFLLKYLNDPELRRTIHAATNKSEQFNDFAQWLMFGGEGVIAENVRHEQRKVIKYNHLVANMVILYNVQWMSRKLKELQQKGHPVDAEVLKVLSPYRREHINRLGDYLLDLQRPVPPLDPTIDFVFKSAA